MTLARSYEEIMERVVVTDEMKARILSRVQSVGPEAPSAPRAASLRRYRRLAALAACFAVLAAGIWGAARLSAPAAEAPPISGVQVVPDLVEASSAEELSALVGFTVSDVAGLPFEAAEAAYTAYCGEMAEIRYRNDEAEAVFRKSAGSEDISGDYGTYDTVLELAVGGITATLKGNSGRYTLAAWSRDGFSYSLSLSSGAALETWSQIIAEAD